MQHLGDIALLNGYDIKPVDLITFGSPCQNLSLVGNREGLSGEQSSLFLEAIRIIKEMQYATNGEYPKYAVWENVPGALSSKNGDDFKTVIEEFAKIKDPKATIPKPKKWRKAGEVLGGNFSIAWRVFDAQYWGIPQRRKRIALVFDLRGESASEILFEKIDLRADTKQDNRERESAQHTAEIYENAEKTGRTITLYDNHMSDARITKQDNVANTVTSRYGTDGNNVPFVTETYAFNSRYGDVTKKEVCSTLIAHMHKDDFSKPLITDSRIRKITPLECERLQGFPDNWTDVPDYVNSKGKTLKTTDAKRYKALGNSIAIPVFTFVLSRIAEHLPQGATLGSLFDGIGGFPLIWERINGKGSAVWASEIEDFPIAVTKFRFKEV